MATTAGFKQQCPSCEAMVPIRDTNLIGRKIDCPKCKYRFVVEEPGAGEDGEADEPQPARKGRRADGKVTKTSARGARRDQDDDDDERPTKEAGPNTKILLGAGLGVAALAILGVVGWLIFSGGDSKPTSPSRPVPAQAASSSDKPSDEEKPAATAAAGGVPAEFLTNLLPPDTEGVCTVHMQSLLRTALGRTIFETPGAFRAVSLSRRLGFPFEDIDLVVQAWNFSQNWSMTIVHTDKVNKPFDLQKIQKALGAKPADKKIDDQEYYVLEGNPWLDQLGRTTFALLLQTPPGQVPARSGPLAFYKFDEQTLLFADLKPMQEFLKLKGAFAHQSEAGQAPEGTEQPKEQAPSERGQGGRGGQMGGGQDRMRMMMMGGGRGMRGGQGGPQGQGGPAGGEEAKPAEEAPVASGSYLTINPALKAMLDRVEGKQPVLSLALDTEKAAAGNVKVLGINPLNLRTLFEEAGIIGAAWQMKDNSVVRLGATYPTEGDAQKHLSSMKSQEVPDLAKALAQALNTRVEKVEDEPAADQGTGGAGPAGPQQGPGGMMPGPQGRGGMMQMQKMQQQQMRGMMGQQGGIGPGGMVPPFGQPPAATQKKDDKPEKPASTIKITTPEKTMIVVTVNLVDQNANSDFLNGPFRNLVLKQKGYLDMASRQLHIHDLVGAVRAYTESPPHQGQFPRGTALRELPSSRSGRPYPPNERVSWLVDLLPYLGAEQQGLYQRIDRNKSWRDPDNLLAATTLIPQFLDPSYPENTWWVPYPGLQQEVAATHVVGIAGVDLGAAEYDASDPAVANQIGVFGYDRVTKLSDLANKGSRTMMFAQVPPTFKRPWLAGGGATVQGVPEHNSVQPFLIERDGKRGALVAMADGSVQFISDKVSDDVFKALATLKGGGDVNLKREATLIPPPENQEPKFVEPPAAPAVPAIKSPSRPQPAKEAPKEAPKSGAQRGGSDEQVRAILQNNCSECHTGATAKKRIQIFLREEVINPNLPRDKMRQVLASGKMPPRIKQPPLQPDDRAALLEWLAAAN